MSLKIEKLTAKDQIELLRDMCFDKVNTNFILVGEEETCFSEYFTKNLEEIKAFEVLDTDIFVASHPKSGTTWLQELVWLVANNCDFEGAKQDLDKRYGFLECTGLLEGNGSINSVACAKQLTSPRFIKTHLPFSLLPDNLWKGQNSTKVIYILRNPKSVCVSYYYHSKLLRGLQMNLETFSESFMSDKKIYGQFWKHVFGYWNHINNENILILTYEDMIRDLTLVIKKVADFLGKRVSDEDRERLCQHLSFKSMKNNKAVNKENIVMQFQEYSGVKVEGSFIRSGKIEKYKEELSKDTISKFNCWIKKNACGTPFEEAYSSD